MVNSKTFLGNPHHLQRPQLYRHSRSTGRHDLPRHHNGADQRRLRLPPHPPADGVHALPEKYERVVALQIGNPYMTVDGMWQTIDNLGTAPMARNNRTLLPIRFVVEYFGATVDYLPERQTVEICK